MRKVFALIILIIFSSGSQGQTLDPDRATDWSLAGFKGSRNVDFTIIDFVEEGGVADGTTVNDAVYLQILTDLAGDPAVIYFPPGDFFFTQTINLRNNLVLRGASTEETTLTFDLGGSGDLILAQGSITSAVSHLTTDPVKDDHYILVDDASLFSANDHVQLIEEDDSLITSSWALHTTGQIVVIDEISTDTVFLKSPLRRAFQTSKECRIVKLNPVHTIGIENLKIDRRDATATQTSNIALYLVVNSWISCIESYNSNFGHIEIRRCSNVDVEGSYMQDAFAYGSGGQGYGVVLQSTSGECLITDNRFKHLRHSMLLQSGANGNVLSYNYSEDPHWTEVFPLPANSSGDLVLHGNYSYMNLFEGNDVAHIVIDDSHGPNGPFNTVFRNRVHLYGIFMAGAANGVTHQTNIIGNEITNPNIIMGFYSVAGIDRFEHGNNLRGQIIPGGTNQLPETSLYLDAAPSYYLDNNSWPPIGVPNTISSHIIQAEDIYDEGYLTTCAADVILSITDNQYDAVSIKVFPVPANSFIRIDQYAAEGLIQQVDIYNTDGKLQMSVPFSEFISLDGLTDGIYLIRAQFKDGRLGTGKIIIAGQ